MTQKQKQKINDKINNGSRSKINSGNFFSYFKVFNKILFVFNLLIVSYFVVSTNDLSIKGFVLNELRLEVNNVITDNERVELKIMELESYDKIDKRAKELKMVKIDKIDYISMSDESVAKR